MKGDAMKCQGKAKMLTTVREDGMVAMEFVILFPLLLLIIVGILEFGHLFYVRHTLTNASREGARAAVMYYTGGDRIGWAQNQAITTVNNYLYPPNGKPRLPGVTVNVPTPQVSGSTTGSTVTVTITATHAALILGEIVTSFNNLTITGQTTMKLE
jgi:Flp pilus assembly protein TadG